ncbi:DUF4097 family beta strand repeat-containing protein [Winogradskya consettensis]|nr:DUF4097 family beta strand repeat-containing protein [Actinoplanes consettensis]
MNRGRGAGPVVTAMVAGAVLAGCGGGGSAHTYDTTVQDWITQIVLEGGNGKVTVRTTPNAATTIRRTTTAKSDPGKFYRVDGRVLLINTSCGLRCDQDYSIEAPAGVAVSGGITANDLTLEGVGSADVGVSAGNITITGATGGVRARSDHGDVTVALTEVANVSAKSATGDVDVTVPPGQYEVTALSAAGGTVTSTVFNILDARNTLDAQTGVGSVTVALAEPGPEVSPSASGPALPARPSRHPVRPK